MAAGSFKTLTSLVKQAGLADTLATGGRFTVFAPTDAAFAKVPKKTLAALGEDRAKLRAVLLYHVARGKLPAQRVVKRSSIKTLNGASVRVKARGKSVKINKAKAESRRWRLQRGDPRHQPGPHPARALRGQEQGRATLGCEEMGRWLWRHRPFLSRRPRVPRVASSQPAAASRLEAAIADAPRVQGEVLDPPGA